jgi:hypothetical protein
MRWARASTYVHSFWRCFGASAAPSNSKKVDVGDENLPLLSQNENGLKEENERESRDDTRGSAMRECVY